MKALLISIFLLLPSFAMAQKMIQMPCGDSKTALDFFEQKYGEVPAAVGMTVDGTVVELLLAPDGSWTLLLLTPDNVACGIASGKDWSFFALPKPGDPS